MQAGSFLLQQRAPDEGGGRARASAPGEEAAGGLGVVHAAHQLGPHQGALGHDAVHLHQPADEARRQRARRHPGMQPQHPPYQRHTLSACLCLQGSSNCGTAGIQRRYTC
jgi:hypothetical protein